MPTSSVSARIRERIERSPPGEPFTPKAFLDLGGRAVVDKSLARLMEGGVIERVARGVYVRPKASRFFAKSLPSPAEVVKVIAETNGEQVSVHGAEAARELGLTTQVPMHPVFLTSGRSRRRVIAGRSVEFKHTKAAHLRAAGTEAGLAIAALLHLGRQRATPEVMERLRKRLPLRDWERLASELPYLPSWVATAVHREQRQAP